jgi:peroxiredoxin
MPTSFLVDRKGSIRHVHQGFRRQDEKAVADQITALLGAA